jgi:hypothetical protein
MLPTDMRFRPLTLEDKPRVDAALAADPPVISELTFTNLWAWRRKREIFLATDETGALVLLCEENGRRFFLPPVGAAEPAATARRLVGFAHDAGFDFRIERAPSAVAGACAAAGFPIAVDRDQFDYVYSVSEIAALAGRHFDGKRNLIRHVTTAHACSFERLDDAAAAECLALEEDWCDLRACSLEAGLAAEQGAIGECLRAHRRLGLIGGLVRVDGLVKAFALGETLAAGTAVVHFEKADPGIKGAYQLMNHWFCRESLAGFSFVNREQDLGRPGLRKTKLDWRPHHLVEKFTVTAAGTAGDPG